jgi:hypothetical protein
LEKWGRDDNVSIEKMIGTSRRGRRREEGRVGLESAEIGRVARIAILDAKEERAHSRVR